MKAYFYETRNCWRVQISIDGGKRRSLYFPNEKKANEKIAELTGVQPVKVVQTADMFIDELVTYLGSKDNIRKAAEFFNKNVLSVRKKGTVQDMCEAYFLWQQGQGRSKKTLAGDRSLLNSLAAAFPGIKATELSASKIMAWVDSATIGSRPNMFKTAHKLCGWGQLNEWLATNPMVGLKKPKTKSAKDIIGIGDFERILRACAGLDPLPELPKRFKPRAGLGIITDFGRALPVFVLGGLAGLRQCEMVKVYVEDQTVQWEDVNWKRKWIKVRHGVAKKTRRDSDLRHPLLCDAAIAWLKPISKPIGPIVDLTDSIFREYRRQLCARLGIHIPTNGLRNSFASYGQSFHTLGEVAKDLGDLEETARKHYVLELEPESGRAWFDIRPDTPAKILQMTG